MAIRFKHFKSQVHFTTVNIRDQKKVYYANHVFISIDDEQVEKIVREPNRKKAPN